MSKKILVIDDDPAVSLFTTRLLESEGYVVKPLDSAVNVESLIAAFEPDLIVSDIMMPGRNGLDICRALKAAPETRHIPIVLASAKAFEGDKRAAFTAGAAGYIVKPFSETDLLNTVRQALSTDITVTVWGSRGAIATPERASGLYGGNTACVTVEVPGHGLIIFDAGTGLRPLGDTLAQAPLRRIALLLTHFHWDHIFGLPFFAPLYMPGNEVHLYAPADSNDALAEKIEKQMGGDYFPVSYEVFRAAFKFHALGQQTTEIEGLTVSTLYAFHPGPTLMYRLELGGHTIVYAPDNELRPETLEPELSGEALQLAEFAAGASLLIHDANYSQAVYATRRGWGHSSGAALAAVVKRAQVKRVLLFHHDPANSDEDVQAIHQEFQTALGSAADSIESEPAREGMTYTLQPPDL